MLTEGDNRPNFTDAKTKLGFHPEKVQKLLEGEQVVPVSVELDLTYICGDNCSFCHFAYTHKNGLKLPSGEWDTSKVMTPKVADRVLGKLSDSGVKSVVFSGGGEPLDSPFALEIFKLTAGYGLDMGMYTRGHGLREEVADFVANNFSWLVVSLDVTNAEDHKKVKGTSNHVFERKVANIKGFSSRTERADISVSALVDSEHLAMVAPYPDQADLLGDADVVKLERDIYWFLNLGVDEVQIRPIVDTGNYYEQRISRQMSGMPFKDDEKAWQEHYSWIGPMISLLKQYERLPGLNVSLDKFQNLYDGLNGYGECDAMLVSSALVGTDGTAYKCVNHRSIAPIGDLINQSVEDIYLDPNLDRKVNSGCRVACRGCKVNKAINEIKDGEVAIRNPLSDVKHPNFI